MSLGITFFAMKQTTLDRKYDCPTPESYMTTPAQSLLDHTAAELVLRVMPMPADTHLGDQIAGGWVLAKLDAAGSVLPLRAARGRVALVAVEKLAFNHPVRLGDLVSFYASVLCVGTTSVSVQVQAYTERRGGNAAKVTEVTMTYVAIDDQGSPTPIRAVR